MFLSWVPLCVSNAYLIPKTLQNILSTTHDASQHLVTKVQAVAKDQECLCVSGQAEKAVCLITVLKKQAIC